MKRVCLLSLFFCLFLASSPSFANTSQFEMDWEEQWEGHSEEEHLADHWLDLAEPFASSYYSVAKPQARRGCFRITCRVWADIDKTTQTMYLYIDGHHVASWPVSTGKKRRSRETPNMDTHPNGRIYVAYNSKAHPGGGDYKGLGNMPYAVFVRGGIAIHGTPERNWRRLGRPASHGCIRLHPDHAQYFMNLVKRVGIRQTWITIRGETPRR